MSLFSECHYAECRYANCRYVECHGALVAPSGDFMCLVAPCSSYLLLVTPSCYRELLAPSRSVSMLLTAPSGLQFHKLLVT